MEEEKIKEKLEFLAREESIQKADVHGLYAFRVRSIDESMKMHDNFLKNGRIKFEQHSNRIQYFMAEREKAALHRDESIKAIREEFEQKRLELTQPEYKPVIKASEPQAVDNQASDTPPPHQEKLELLDREEKERIKDIEQIYQQRAVSIEKRMEEQGVVLDDGRLPIREYNNRMTALSQELGQAALHKEDAIKALNREYAEKRSELTQPESEREMQRAEGKQETQSSSLTPEQTKKAERERLIAEFQGMKKQQTKKIKRRI